MDFLRRYFFFALYMVVAFAFILFGSANWVFVEVRLLPAFLTQGMDFGLVFPAPLFVLLIIAAAVGVGVGIFLEWLRAARVRAKTARMHRELARLRKSAKAQSPAPGGADSAVLALLESADNKET